jgi:hypothetical protein
MPLMPCAWQWKDFGGGTRTQHVVINHVREFDVLICGTRLESNSAVVRKVRPKPPSKCRRCLLALRSQIAAGLKLMPVHDIDAISRKATRSARRIEERLHHGIDD